MTSSIGYALGIGSGLDIRALVDGLSDAARAPKEELIFRRESLNQARISAVAEISNAIDGFATALAGLLSGGSLYSQPTVSEPTLLAATVIPGAQLGALSHEIEVVQLAKAQTLESAVFAADTDPVGQGTLTLTTAAGSFAVTVDASNDSLGGLATAINGAGAGVTATVVTDTNGARLVLKGATGEAAAFTLSVPDGTVSGLERFAYGPAVTGGMTLAQAAQDAVVRLDGVEVRRSANSFKDLIQGVQIDLKKAAPGSTISLGVARPSAAIEQAVHDFVATYNGVMGMIAELTAPGAAGEGGPLRGDLGVREMQRQLRQLPSTALVGQGTGPKTLAEIGVRTNRDGTLSVDTSRLQKMLATDPQGVEALFNPSQHSSDPNIVIKSLASKVKPGTYTATNLVPSDGVTGATGTIDGVAAISSGPNIIAPAASPAVGLILGINAAAASVTITIDPGLGGALDAIRDTLRARSGPFATTQARLSAEARDIAEDRQALEMRSEKYYNQLLSTFTAMERQVSAFKATQSYLEQQVKMWTADRG